MPLQTKASPAEPPSNIASNYDQVPPQMKATPEDDAEKDDADEEKEREREDHTKASDQRSKHGVTAYPNCCNTGAWRQRDPQPYSRVRDDRNDHRRGSYRKDNLSDVVYIANRSGTSHSVSRGEMSLVAAMTGRKWTS